MGKRKPENSDPVVRLEDTYDPADYVLVHKVYFDRMREALREAHRHINDESGGDTASCICIYCSPPPQQSPQSEVE